MKQQNLISLIKAGDRQAFDSFCRERIPMLMSYARAFLPDGWAEDVVQDVLFGLWSNRDSLDEARSVRSYLLRSIHNRSLNYFRSTELSKKYKEWNGKQLLLIGAEGADPDKNDVIRKLYDMDLREGLRVAIDGLSPRCREAFNLSYIEGLSNKETAERMGVSTSTVENHIHSALRKLRNSLSEEALLFLLILHFFHIE